MSPNIYTLHFEIQSAMLSFVIAICCHAIFKERHHLQHFSQTTLGTMSHLKINVSCLELENGPIGSTRG